MPTVHVEANLSAEQLLQAVRQLDRQELDAFTDQVLALRAGHRAPVAGTAEAELLVKINAGLPAELRRRYEGLIARRQAEILSGEEQQELIQLSEQVEQLEVERLRALTALAQLRRVSLGHLMQQMGLNGKANG